MDVATISAMAVDILLRYVMKAGDKVAEKAGEAIFNFIKKKFRGDKEAARTLSNFALNPSQHKKALHELLGEKITNDAEFARALSELLSSIKSDLSKGTVRQVAFGTGIAQSSGTDTSAKVTIRDN